LPLAGGFAVLLLSTLPAFVSFSRSSMSDIGGCAFATLAFVSVYFGLNGQRRWQIYLGAILLGAAFDVRTQFVFFLPLLLAMALFPGEQSRAAWLFHCVGALLVFGIAASPLFFINYGWFHNPFSMGYDFWVPGMSHMFSVQNIPKHARLLWADAALQRHDFSVADMFGTGTHFVPPFLLLAGIGCVLVKFSRFVICAGLSVFSFVASTAIHGFAEGRYYLPILILLIAVAVLALDWATKMIFARRRLVAAFLIFGLFVLACIGFPSQSGYPPTGGRSQAWDALHFTDRPRRSGAFIAVEEMLKTFQKEPGIVLSDINPVYLNTLLPRPFIAAPIDGKHKYNMSNIWRYDDRAAKTLVTRGLNQSLPAYALFVSQREMAEQAGRLPKISGYQWVVAGNRMVNVGILKLAAEPSE
jgi:hypothetical protein